MVDPEILGARRPRRKKIVVEASLIAAALRCFMKGGVEQATIASICAEAQISVGSAYHAVPGGKPALLRAAYRQVAHDLLSQLQGASAGSAADPARVILSRLLKPYVTWFEEHRQEAVFLLQVEAMWFEPDIKLMINEIADGTQKRVSLVLATLTPAGKRVEIPDSFVEALVFGQVRILLAQCLRGARNLEVVKKELPALAGAVAAGLSGYQPLKKH